MGHSNRLVSDRQRDGQSSTAKRHGKKQASQNQSRWSGTTLAMLFELRLPSMTVDPMLTIAIVQTEDLHNSARFLR
jgi:hypothetical protein